MRKVRQECRTILVAFALQLRSLKITLQGFFLPFLLSQGLLQMTDLS